MNKTSLFHIESHLRSSVLMWYIVLGCQCPVAFLDCLIIVIIVIIMIMTMLMIMIIEIVIVMIIVIVIVTINIVPMIFQIYENPLKVQCLRNLACVY